MDVAVVGFKVPITNIKYSSVLIEHLHCTMHFYYDVNLTSEWDFKKFCKDHCFGNKSLGDQTRVRHITLV